MFAAMKTCPSLYLIAKLIFIIQFPDLQAQKLKVKPEVIGYLNEEVILDCHVVPGPDNFTIILVEWDLASLKGDTTILVFDGQHGMSIKDSPLKQRVNLTDFSLKIRDVKMTDAGLYTCSVTTFPKGPLKENIKLEVRDESNPKQERQTQMSAGILSAIIISAALLLVILTAAAYLTYVRRHKAARRLQVHIDTSSRVASVTRPSYIFKDPEVVYADVRPKRTRNSGASLNKMPKTPAKAEEVTYAEVKVYHQRPNLENVFSV